MNQKEELEKLRAENAALRDFLTEIAEYDVSAQRNGWAAAVYEMRKLAQQALGWDGEA